MHTVIILDPRAQPLVRADSVLERLATGATWSEGPVWLHEDGSVLWSDIPANRMLRWHPSEGQSTWRDGAEFTNGHTREADGALLHCSHGRRAIVRTRFAAGLQALPDEIVVDRYQGRRLNSPNDVIVQRDGTIWFTDPPYGILSDHEGHRADPELRGHYVFRFDPASGALDIASDFVEEPNGLAFSPDESVLYVADTSAALRSDGSGHHHIVAFDVLGGRTLARPRIFAVIEPGLADGFRIDRRGWLYTSSADSVQVYHQDGTRLAKIPVPEKVGNLCFGGAERDELFICASSSLYRIRLNAQGVQQP
ncbi:SMP-30/gluconolactonase/LRE family protein [Aquabacterium sp.]|uniref:SMP-30/gluconolactonase/LRE family protein n=1 Tax=Aquabacterium sp. TaxID=1872578 RepID=UPI002CD63A94|nr:SMP-30/gluconolactonase/LRE family protein [Aquabacterium sp.]HSW06000.1 SMP-30/gluconolactonase/LRE family protein [Aquabacterium sp.]